jgi:hypothetical protein
MKTLTLQPAPRVDGIDPDGHERTQLPYPFHVAETGEVQRQDFWQGSVFRIIGFTDRPEPGTITIPWPAAVRDPQSAVGHYIVSSDDKGNWATHVVAVDTVTVHE